MRRRAMPRVRRRGALAAAFALGLSFAAAGGLAAQAAPAPDAPADTGAAATPAAAPSDANSLDNLFSGSGENAAAPAGSAASGATGAADATTPAAAPSNPNSLDDLFSGATTAPSSAGATAPAGAAASAPAAAAPATASGAGGSIALAALQTNQPLTFTGNIYSMAGGALGYANAPDWSNPLTGLAPLGGGSVTNYIYFDARPDPTVRFHGALEMAFPGFALTMYELWFDYSVLDKVFFRGGRQVIGWGNTRIFTVGDVMDNSPTALSLKTYLPFGADGLSLVTLVQDPGAGASLVGLKPEIAPRLDLVFGSFEFSEAGAFQHQIPARLASMLKTSHFGIDFFAEVFGNWQTGSPPVLSTFESAFWQAPGQKFSLYAEHYYNGSSTNAADGWYGTPPSPPNLEGSKIAILGSYKIGGYTVGLQWNHAFADGSGQLMPALTFSPFNHITVTFGFPITYGPDGSTYAGQAPADFNSPIYNPSNLTNPNLASPIPSWNQRYSVFLKVELATTY